MERLRPRQKKTEYQPRIRADRLRDLHEMKQFTGRPLETLVDEALAIYLANFMTSPEYTSWCDAMERQMDEHRDHDNEFDLWDIGDFYDV